MADAHTLTIEGGSLRYTWGVHRWSVAIDDIRVIGEATNDHGPFADDWFLCIATDAEGWSEASMYADGVSEAIAAVGERLGADLLPGLAGSTEYASG